MDSGLRLSAHGMAEPLRNLITDVPGIKIGHAEDLPLGSGATAIVFDEPAVASIDVRGGGPGTRETALLDPAQTVEGIDAITLSGGSAFGLDAASGVQAWLEKRAAASPCAPRACRSFRRRSCSICSAAATRNGAASRPIASSAMPPRLQPAPISLSAASAPAPARPPSIAKAESARPRRKRRTATSSARSPAVNAVGSVIIGRGPWFWAAPFERDGEFGGRGWPASFPAEALEPVTKGSARESTTLVVVATDAILTKAQAKRLAVMAQSGLSRAIYPVHTPLDGDVVFAASTGRQPLADALLGLTDLGTIAANVVARAIARGVFAATALPLPGALPSWQDQFGRYEPR